MSKTRVAVLASNNSLSDGITKSPDSWNTMNQVNNFIHSIDLPALNTESGDVYGILTAIPSPWVRAYMMKNALTVEYVTDFAKKYRYSSVRIVTQSTNVDVIAIDGKTLRRSYDKSAIHMVIA